jgi:hypothetical protein
MAIPLIFTFTSSPSRKLLVDEADFEKGFRVTQMTSRNLLTDGNDFRKGFRELE